MKPFQEFRNETAGQRFRRASGWIKTQPRVSRMNTKSIFKHAEDDSTQHAQKQRAPSLRLSHMFF
jgi:hypothetical protein